MTENLEAYLDKLEYLPPVPTLMLELMSLFNQPERDVDRVVELISHDPAVTAEILKRCNSVLVRGSEPISNMFEAVFRLGFQEIYFIVVAMFGAQVVETANSATFFDVQAVWRHSVSAAISAQVMAGKIGTDESLAFTAGILHDVGKVILALSDKQEYLTGRQYLKPSDVDSLLTEGVWFGFDHAEIGSVLLNRWMLPANVVDAVLCHHEPGQAEGDRLLAYAVAFGNLLAHHLGDESLEPLMQGPNTLTWMNHLKIKEGDIPPLLDAIEKKIKRSKGLLSR
jgi:putative nucleotidyltransferase with HDIG domain